MRVNTGRQWNEIDRIEHGSLSKTLPLPLYLPQRPHALPCRYQVRRSGYFETPATLLPLSSTGRALKTVLLSLLREHPGSSSLQPIISLTELSSVIMMINREPTRPRFFFLVQRKHIANELKRTCDNQFRTAYSLVLNTSHRSQ